VKIIPLGLNYYDPRSFQSDVIMHFGDPIDFGDISEPDKKERVRLMTERIREKMSELVLHFDQEDFSQISKDVYTIYGAFLKTQGNSFGGETAQIYRQQKEILEAVHFFHQYQPEKLKKITSKAKSLKEDLKKHKLDLMYMSGYRWPTILLIRLIFGLPLFIVGGAINIIPLAATKWSFEKYMRPKFAETYKAGKLNPSFLASMVFIIGMAVFLIWYLLLSLGLVVLTGLAWLIPVLVVVGYGLGVYAARYSRMWFDFVRMVRVINRRRRRPDAYKMIMKKWDDLIGEMNKLKSEYQAG
jgi:hypothetical protein